MHQSSQSRRRAARVRPYLLALAEPAPPPSLLHRVLHGLRSLPDRGPAPAEDRSPLVRFIDAERARTVADRTPTAEIPVVTPDTAAQGVSRR